MRNLIFIFLFCLLCSFAYGQTVAELYNKKDFQSLIKFEKESDKLTSDELYMLGLAFFQLENDNKAIEFYDKAISKGLDSAFVHYDKALSLRYSKRFDEAIKEFDIAIKKDSNNQMYMNDKGFTYYYSDQLDKALPVFLEAQKLPNDVQTPFYMAAHIYLVNKEFDKALKGFYNALTHISKDNKYYVMALEDIGMLEYAKTKDFAKSAKAYEEVISIAPKNYELYPKLIKSYNAGKQYAKADSIFKLMKIGYERKELPEGNMEFKNAEIDEYEWNKQKMKVYKYLVDPTNVLDIFYKVYLLSKAGDKIERTFMVEQTMQNPDNVKYLLCEGNNKTHEHITYPYGWKTDSIPLEDLKRAVGLVLDGKMNRIASSKSKDK